MSLRVCYLMPRLPLTESGVVVGGCATNCVSLALELKRQGHQIEILAPVPKKSLGHLSCHPLAEIIRPIPSFGAGLIGKGLGAIHVLRQGLKKRLQEIRFDVVHSHSGTYPYAIVPLAVNHNTCVRLHSLYCPIGAEGGVYSRWWEKPAAARFIFNKLDRVIAVTDNVAKSIQKTGLPSGKIESIPMCVDTRRFYPREHKGPSRYFPSESRGARILFVGNSSKEKGLTELIKAVKILAEQRIPVFLVAAIENESKIRQYSQGYHFAKALIKKLWLENHVRLLGLIDPIEDLYAESDLIIIPWNTSRGPSDFPMVALEGMAMGKCIISTRVGGCPELLKNGQAGILTEGFSSNSIAAAIEFAIKHPEIQKQIVPGAIEAAKNLSLEKCGGQMITLYERLISEKMPCNE